MQEKDLLKVPTQQPSKGGGGSNPYFPSYKASDINNLLYFDWNSNRKLVISNCNCRFNYYIVFCQLFIYRTIYLPKFTKNEVQDNMHKQHFQVVQSINQMN